MRACATVRVPTGIQGDRIRPEPCCNAPRGAATLGASLEEEHFMLNIRKLALAGLTGAALGAPAQAQTTLTFSSWVPPTHHLTLWQANWAADVEKATNGRVKFQMLAQASVGAARNVRRRARRPRRRLVCHGELHAGAPPAAPARRASRRRRDGRDQLGRVLAHPLEVPAGGQRIQGREAARRVHARAGPDVHGEKAREHGRRPRPA